jgi:hypothetical protein
MLRKHPDDLLAAPTRDMIKTAADNEAWDSRSTSSQIGWKIFEGSASGGGRWPTPRADRFPPSLPVSANKTRRECSDIGLSQLFCRDGLEFVKARKLRWDYDDTASVRPRG